MSFRLVFVSFALSLIIISSCSSQEEKTKKAEADKKVRVAADDAADKELLRYDPKKGDPWIADFVQNLHRKSGFNGNMLVARKGKILYEKSVGWADYLHRDSLKINSELSWLRLLKHLPVLQLCNW